MAVCDGLGDSNDMRRDDPKVLPSISTSTFPRKGSQLYDLLRARNRRWPIRPPRENNTYPTQRISVVAVIFIAQHLTWRMPPAILLTPDFLRLALVVKQQEYNGIVAFPADFVRRLTASWVPSSLEQALQRSLKAFVHPFRCAMIWPTELWISDCGALAADGQFLLHANRC